MYWWQITQLSAYYKRQDSSRTRHHSRTLFHIRCITAPKVSQNSIWPVLTFKFKFTSLRSEGNNTKYTDPNLSRSLLRNIPYKYYLNISNINKGNVIVAQLIVVANIILSSKQTQVSLPFPFKVQLYPVTFRMTCSYISSGIGVLLSCYNSGQPISIL